VFGGVSGLCVEMRVVASSEPGMCSGGVVREIVTSAC